MNVLDLFSGIGGISLGLERAGMRTVAFCEREPAPRHWLAQHWPGVPIFDDVRTLTAESLRGLGRIDIIAGGFPCQPFSVAGKQAGTEDERHLWPHFARLIREIRPRWVLAENVPGLRTIAADLVLEDLEKLGYTAWPLVVGADDVGAPHRRKRVWIVAHRSGGGLGTNGSPRDEGGHVDLCGKSELAHPTRHGGRTREDAWPDRERVGTSGRPVGEPTGAGLEGQRTDARQPQESEPRHDGPRWPARPGEPQHAWEAPRLAYSTDHGRNRRAGPERERSPEAGDGARPACHGSGMGDTAGARLDSGGCLTGGEIRHEGWWPEPERRSVSGMADSPSEPPRSPGLPRQEPDPGEPESRLGDAVDWLPRRVAGLRTSYTSAHRREALKALGNAVVPPLVEAIGRAIMRMDSERVA